MTKNKDDINAILVDVSEIIDGDLCNTGIEEYIMNDKNYDQTKKLESVAVEIESTEERQSYQGIDHDSLKQRDRSNLINFHDVQSTSPHS